jgi:hypothetical protein
MDMVIIFVKPDTTGSHLSPVKPGYFLGGIGIEGTPTDDAERFEGGRAVEVHHFICHP